MLQRLALVTLAGMMLAAPAARAADTMDPQLREKARRAVDAGLNYLRSQQAEDGSVAKSVGITALSLTEQAEKDLAKLLISYDQAIAIAAAECRPNYLTSYLFDLAQGFSRFYNACPVLQADPAQRPGRLLLCDLTARTIRHGLTALLGIEVVEQM